MYKYINKNSEDFKKRIWKAFNNNRLRLMRFNELNLLTAQDEVGKLFLKIQQMYQDFFDNVLEEFDLPKDFLAKHLDEFNPTMMYAFLNEMERKQSRYADSIWGLSQEDKRLTYSLNHWKAMNNMTATAGNVSRQIIEEAIDLERYATLDAWAEEGVEEVMWVTAGDEKVCEECGPLDGKVFKIDEVPERPHWNCRCELQKFEKEKAETIKNEHIDNKKPETALKNSDNDGMLSLPDIQIFTSVGAKAFVDTVLDLVTKEEFKIVEGTTITDVKVFAGKDSHKEYRDAWKYVNPREPDITEWQHVKGIAIIDYYGEPVKAEVHWSQYQGARYDMFVKEYLEFDDNDYKKYEGKLW